MIIELKEELSRVAGVIGATFSSRSNPELEDFVQGFDFATPLINLLPISDYKLNVVGGGVMRYNFTFNLYFITNFQVNDTLEDSKDIKIDAMNDVSESFFSELNKNSLAYFINPNWDWSNRVIRQYTSNLTCGIVATINIDTACNRVPSKFSL